MVTPDKMNFYPGTLLLCAVSRLPRSSQHARSELQGGHVQCQGRTAKQVVGWERSPMSQPQHWPPPPRVLAHTAVYQVRWREVSLYSSWGFLCIPPPPQMPFLLLHRMVTLFTNQPGRMSQSV